MVVIQIKAVNSNNNHNISAPVFSGSSFISSPDECERTYSLCCHLVTLSGIEIAQNSMNKHTIPVNNKIWIDSKTDYLATE